jgi:hypothetical protein
MNRIIIYFCLLATAFGMASADDHLSMTIPELRERLTESWLIKSKSPEFEFVGVITRKKDIDAVSIDHNKKSYRTIQENGMYKIDGAFYSEVYLGNTEEYKILDMGKKSWQYVSVVDGKCNIENVISESKTRHSTLPDSLIPKG